VKHTVRERILAAPSRACFRACFADWGVVLLDASDSELHRIAAPIYSAAIERAAELDDALLARGRNWKRRAITSRSR